MNDENDPLDQLFEDAKEIQDQVASTAAVGVETRLRNQLESKPKGDGDLWCEVLNRLCAAGGVMAVGLTIWALMPLSSTLR